MKSLWCIWCDFCRHKYNYCPLCSIMVFWHLINWEFYVAFWIPLSIFEKNTSSTSNNAIFFLHYRYLLQLIFHFWSISVIYTLVYFWCINDYDWPWMKNCGLSIFIMFSKIASLLYCIMENIKDTSLFWQWNRK